MKRILYAETVREDQEALQRIVSSGDLYYGLTVVDSIEQARKALEKGGIDLALLSIGLDEPETYTIIEDFEEIPFVILPGEGNERTAVQAFRAGAADYLVKDEQGKYLSQLPGVVEKAIQKKKAAQERKSHPSLIRGQPTPDSRDPAPHGCHGRLAGIGKPLFVDLQ
jgi:DNA-binding NtrC family response regulator